jgi:hypothetical protein
MYGLQFGGCYKDPVVVVKDKSSKELWPQTKVRVKDGMSCNF